MDGELKQLVRVRAEHRCEYCHIPQKFFIQLFQIEHIVARSHGGTDEADNLALACRLCNLHKGPNLSGIDPESKVLTRLFNPRTDRWSDYFRFGRNGDIIGLSEIGRTTAFVLNMNAKRRVELRLAIVSRQNEAFQ